LKTRRPPSQVMRLPLSALEHDLTQRRSNPQIHLRPAVFVDRDGTLNVERGYLSRPEEVALLPTVGKALGLLNRLGIPVIVITNQSALGRGVMKWAEFEAVNAALWKALQDAGAFYDALYYCPHAPNGNSSCGCRKPQPGLLLQAALDLNLDLPRCFVVGDKRSDLEAGRICGCYTVLVRTGWGEETHREMLAEGWEPDCVADTLLEATRWIELQLGSRASP